MLPELMILIATATVNLESPSFHVRRTSENALAECGIFAGAHVEVARKSKDPEVRMRAERLWTIINLQKFLP
jgi:hypothetical protein